MSDRAAPLLRWALAAALAAGAAGAAATPLGYGDPTEPSPRAGLPHRGGDSEDAPPEPKFDLSSTLVAGARRVAIINGRSVALGATIDGARLMAVDGRGVMLVYEGRHIRLELPGRDGDTVTAKTPRGP